MKNISFVLFLSLISLSCNRKEVYTECNTCGLNLNITDEPSSMTEEISVTTKETNLSKVEKKDFEETKVKIEKKYGEQWDFCQCVVVNDSIDRLIKDSNLTDSQLDAILMRLDEVDKRCQAFKITDPSRTPEDRMKHEKKINKCLKDARRI
jgi:hypothetical protein